MASGCLQNRDTFDLFQLRKLELEGIVESARHRLFQLGLLLPLLLRELGFLFLGFFRRSLLLWSLSAAGFASRRVPWRPFRRVPRFHYRSLGLEFGGEWEPRLLL